MNQIKQLFGHTMVYGLGIVLPRLLNFVILTPYHTRQFEPPEYGIITELYAYVVVLIIILTYGMETGYFRYASHSENKESVYKSILISVFTTSSLFILLISSFIGPVSSLIGYEEYPRFIKWLAVIVAVDAFTAIPFARIRLYNKAVKYVIIRLIEISVTVGLNFFFISYCAHRYEDVSWIAKIYNPDLGVGYVLLSNMIASLLKLLLLSGEIATGLRGRFDFSVLKEVLNYSYPLLIAGLAGAVNEALDRILLKHLIDPASNPMAQLGIYGANFKVAVLMTLYVQAFRYAAEPFFFSKSKQKDEKRLYADVMKFYLIPGLFIFLLVNFYIDYFKLFIDTEYHVGIYIVPIVLMANLLVGVFFNLSIWYKLKNKTLIGAFLVITGAIITIVINLVFVPKYGFLASAYGHLICYSVMIFLSWLLSRKHYRIPYNLKRISVYFVIVLTFYFIDRHLSANDFGGLMILKPILLLSILAIFYLGEKNDFKRYTK